MMIESLYSGLVMRRQSISKGQNRGSATSRAHRLLGASVVLNITKEVNKTVSHPQTGKDVKRSCKVTLNVVDPKSEDWLEDAIAICGGDSNLAARVYNFGLVSWVRQQETNRLGQTDEVSKAAAGIINNYVKMLGITPEEARAQLMANPLVAGKLQSAVFEQFVETKIEDFSAYQTKIDDRNISKSRFPDVTDVGEDSEDKTEDK